LESRNILIHNPFNSSRIRELTSAIENNVPYKYTVIKGLDHYDLSLPQLPGLIFLIIDEHILAEEEIFRINNFYSGFKSAPVIGLLNTTIQKDISVLQKILWSYLPLPFSHNDILFTINWYLQNEPEMKKETVYSFLKSNTITELFKGDSDISLSIKEKIIKAASYDVTVLLTGETGTGKELSAKIIHFLSDRSDKPFIPVNCGSIPKELFENELFGHKKGAYTHADSNEEGVIASAEKGTLFLDEIESLTLPLQVKLLRFLEDKQYKPLGQSKYVHSNVRIIAAAQDNLQNLLSTGQFREDLYYRLNIVNIKIRPLRERRDDIPVLVYNCIDRFSKLHSKDIRGINSLALFKLFNYHWPGNVRELENVLHEAIILNTNGWIEPEDLNLSKFSIENQEPVSEFNSYKQNAILNIEKDYLINVMRVFSGNISKASKAANKDRREFYRLLRKHKIDPSPFRSDSGLKIKIYQ
jgi:DNA-binding NtrC family response regulator